MAADGVSPDRGGAPAVTPPSVRPITRTEPAPGKDKVIGRVIGQCRLLKRIGRGGMGDVYLAEHLEFDRTVAIKILPPDFTRNDELIVRFRREAMSAGRLEHPNLVEIYDVGEENGFNFIVMEYIEGQNLQDLLEEKGRLDSVEAARIGYEVARGLQAVHDEHIIHRDIKPGNILLTGDGRVKIVDFGLAFDAEDKTSLTVSGSVMGTPHYLSPEQAEGKRADSRSDLYSLGVCLYLLVTGVRPFLGESHMSILYKQIHEKPKDPRHHNSAVPSYLAKLILRALEKRAERRYSSAEEFARELDRFVKGDYPRRTPIPIPEPISMLRGAQALGAAARNAARNWNPLVTFALVAWILIVGASLLSVTLLTKKNKEDFATPAPAAAAAVEPASVHPEESAPEVEPVPVPEPTPEPAPEPAPEPEPAPVVYADLENVLTDEDRRDISLRDYAPAMRRLLDRHTVAATRAEKEAISRVGVKLSGAFKVVTQYRTVIASENNPVLRLRDGRTTQYAFTALPALHGRSVVDYARRSREVTELDLAFFWLADGDAMAALDHVISGTEIRPEARAYVDEFVQAAIAQDTDPSVLAARLEPVRTQLPPATVARLDSIPD